ncbi:hypothetical protein JW906_04705 [bacterium]|nr:hypothetical protein [bacterium]
MKRLHRCKTARFLFLLPPFMALLLPASLSSQTGKTVLFFKKRIRVAGQAQVFGELYDVQGTSRRRPPSTGRIAFTPTLVFSSLFSVSADLMLSTEGSSARQNMNILGLHPVWAWGRAHAGDFSDHFSASTFSGVNVKGAEIDLFPGLFRFAAGGGRTKRAVDGNVIHQNYSQYLAAGRIGYGSTNASFLDLILVKVKDDASSLSKPEQWEIPKVLPDTLETELDTLWVEPPYNPYAVTPQENLVMGFSGRLQLLNSRIVLKMEGSGSAYTKNLETDIVDIDSVDMPDFLRTPLKKIFTPRRSSNMDFAGMAHLNVNLEAFRAEMGYRMTGPGYLSLGIPSTVNDRQEWLFNTSARLGIHRIQLQWNRMSDNLAGQKLLTNIRNQFGAGLNTTTQAWQSNIQIQYLLMGNDAPSDSLQYDFNNFIMNIHESVAFGKNALLRRLGIQYTLQRSTKKTYAGEDRAGYHTINLTGAFQAARSIAANASAGLSFRKSGQADRQVTQVYSLRLTHTAMANKLSNSIFSSSSMIRDTRVFRMGLRSSYRLTPQNQLAFDLSHNVFRGNRDFHETRSSLTISHRF